MNLAQECKPQLTQEAHSPLKAPDFSAFVAGIVPLHLAYTLDDRLPRSTTDWYPLALTARPAGLLDHNVFLTRMREKP
jgi:hypothetical protein